MKDKIVLVTGANGGLGSSVTQAFLDAGATVIGTSRNIRQAEFSGTAFTAISADLASDQGARALVAQVLSKFGRIHVLVHTVGGFAGGKPIVDTDDATFQSMFEMNFYSTFYLLKAAIPVLRQSQAGRVIAIGSRAAVEPGANVGAYSASKAAMVSLIRTVALENLDAGMTPTSFFPGQSIPPQIARPCRKPIFPNESSLNPSRI